MTEHYIVKKFDELKDGEPVLAYGCHALRWNFGTMGDPAYGIVPVDCDTALDEIERLREALEKIVAKATNLPPFHAYGDNEATVRMVVDLEEISEMAEAALKGGE